MRMGDVSSHQILLSKDVSKNATRKAANYNAIIMTRINRRCVIHPSPNDRI